MDSNTHKKPIFTYVLIVLIVLLVAGFLILKTCTKPEAQPEPDQDDISAVDDIEAEEDFDPSSLNTIAPKDPIIPSPPASQPTTQPQAQDDRRQVMNKIVNSHKGQLDSKYRNLIAHQQSSGTVKITIYANPGNLDSVEATQTSGNLSEDFLRTIESTIRNWDFGKVKEKTIYTFTMNFK